MLFSHIHASRISLLTVVITILVTSPRIALSYEISPRKKVHETLTLMASDCLRQTPEGARPSSCLPSNVAVIDRKALKDAAPGFEAPKLGEVSAKELAQAVRWPDDPTREVGIWTIFKFAVKLLGQCERKYSGGLQHGLLCSSHHGPLQFWHAMALDAAEPTEVTQRKMLAWAGFLYEVTAMDDSALDDDYCKYWRAQQEKGEGELADILAPKNLFPCNEEGPEWTISTLFSMTCESPFSSKKCTELLEPHVARVNALGALLHMVQDSYAQGHASRGLAEKTPNNKRIVSKFECLPISQFYTYSEQNTKKHRQADAPPKPGLSCAGAPTAVDDPILASATVLWFVQQKKGAPALREYLSKRVFPLAEGHKLHAGAGDCFAKKSDRHNQCPASK
jgi:hypothetical protein